MGRIGRPKLTLRATDYGRITQLSARGISERELAEQLGVSWNTWKRLKAEDERAADALRAGRAREETALVGALFSAAIEKGNVVAAIFLLKARHGYQDTPAPKGDGPRVAVVFQLPAPLDRKQYAALLEAAPPKAIREAGVSDAG